MLKLMAAVVRHGLLGTYHGKISLCKQMQRGEHTLLAIPKSAPCISMHKTCESVAGGVDEEEQKGKVRNLPRVLSWIRKVEILQRLSKPGCRTETPETIIFARY